MPTSFPHRHKNKSLLAQTYLDSRRVLHACDSIRVIVVYLQQPVFIIPLPKRQRGIHLVVQLVRRGGRTPGVLGVEREAVPTYLTRAVKRLIHGRFRLEWDKRNKQEDDEG